MPEGTHAPLPIAPRRLSPTLAGVAVVGAGVAYPFLVGFLSGSLPVGVWVVFALCLVAGRLLLLRRSQTARTLVPPLVVVGLTVLALSGLSAHAAAQAYPVLMSLAFASAFGLSLLRPPSLIETFTTLSPQAAPPTPRARAYMRRVTVIWLVFLVINAGLCAATALWMSPAVWAIYSGAVSYALMGLLFAGEWLIRRRVQAQDALP